MKKSKLSQHLIVLAVIGVFSLAVRGEDWPMLGRDRTRNPVSREKNAPIEWDVKSGKNIKWKARLGSITFSDPIVARGLVWKAPDPWP